MQVNLTIYKAMNINKYSRLNKILLHVEFVTIKLNVIAVHKVFSLNQ